MTPSSPSSLIPVLFLSHVVHLPTHLTNSQTSWILSKHTIQFEYVHTHAQTFLGHQASPLNIHDLYSTVFSLHTYIYSNRTTCKIYNTIYSAITCTINNINKLWMIDPEWKYCATTIQSHDSHMTTMLSALPRLADGSAMPHQLISEQIPAKTEVRQWFIVVLSQPTH